MKTINPIECPGWDKLIIKNPSCCVFHTSGWSKVICDSYKYKSEYFIEFENDKIETLIPFMEVDSIFTGKRGVSLPFTDYCEPIINKNKKFSDYIDILKNYGKIRRWDYIELRGVKTQTEITPYSYYYIHTLDLSRDDKEIFKKLKSSNKRNIKKAVKSEVQTHISCEYESIKEFYRLHCITRKKHGLPPQPYRFFENIFYNIIAKKHGIIVMAYYNGSVVSAAVFFHFGKKVIYKYGASDYRYQHLRGNNIVMWEAIKWYCRNGYQSFCFGRTSPGNKGLLQFKSGWGAKTRTINYYKYDLHKNRFIRAKTNKIHLFNKVFNKMPTFFLRFIGAALYPHIG